MRRIRAFCGTLALCVAALNVRAYSAPDRAVVAYVFPQNNALQPGDIDAQRLTRINYAFANIADGRMVAGFAIGAVAGVGFGVAIGMSRTEAMALAIRCARNSMPPLRLAILEDIAANPGSRIVDVRRRLQRPRATADRALQALHVLGLLICDEEEQPRDDGPHYVRHYRLSQGVKLGVLGVTKNVSR